VKRCESKKGITCGGLKIMGRAEKILGTGGNNCGRGFSPRLLRLCIWPVHFIRQAWSLL